MLGLTDARRIGAVAVLGLAAFATTRSAGQGEGTGEDPEGAGGGGGGGTGSDGSGLDPARNRATQCPFVWVVCLA